MISQILVLLVITCMFLSWIYIYIQAKRFGQDLPWQLAVIMVAVFFSGQGLKIGIIYLDWFVMITLFCLVTFPSQKLYEIYITKDNLLITILTGILFGTLLVILLHVPYEIFILQTWNFPYLTEKLIFYTILSAASEELLFRGFLLGHLRKVNVRPVIANAFQAILFALFHSNYLLHGNFYLFSIMLVVGFVCGYTTLRYKNIIGAILIHIMINLL